jgi:hypothetical protein
MEMNNTSQIIPVSAVESVTASRIINKYEKDNNLYANPNNSDKWNTDKSWNYYTVTQIVLMETSVYDHLGKNVNVYI